MMQSAEIGDIFHDILHEPLPETDREWALRLRFAPTVERAFLRSYIARVERWILLASALLGALVGVRLLAAPYGQLQDGALLIGSLLLGLISLAVAGIAAAGVAGRIHLTPTRLMLIPCAIVIAIVAGNLLLFQMWGRTSSEAQFGLFQATALSVLALRMRVRHSLPLLLVIAGVALSPAWFGQRAITPDLIVQAGMATMSGLMISFLLEYDARRDFLSQARIYRIATTDALSQTLNRRAFFERAELEVARARRYGLPLALLLIDIDRFKQINDRYGHPAGDQVIARVGALCRAHLRTSDLLGRIGGEEFAILLTATDSAGALQVGERLRIMLAASSVMAGSHGPITFSVSGGVSALHEDIQSLSDLIGSADLGLYAAKRSGRNRVCCAPESESAPIGARMIGGRTIGLTAAP